MTNTNKKAPNSIVIDLLLAIAIVGYSLPWLVSSGVGLQPNAYDLAEWLTLHPTVRATSSILLPALLIRFVLPAIGWLLLLNLHLSQTRLRRIVYWLLISGIFIALNPPLDFFRGQFRDLNYQQQVFLWILYGDVCIVFALFHSSLPIKLIIAILAALGAICVVWGTIHAYQLMILYEIQFSVGIGVFACFIALVAIASIFATQK